MSSEHPCVRLAAHASAALALAALICASLGDVDIPPADRGDIGVGPHLT